MNPSLEDLRAFAPLFVLALAICVTVVLVAARASRHVVTVVARTSLALSLASLFLGVDVLPRSTPFLAMDRFGALFGGLILLASLACTVFAIRSRETTPTRERSGPFHPLLLLATFGALVLATSRHVATLFLGLELLSVALYGLIAIERTRESALRAGLTYLVLAGVSSGFFLFGAALQYACLGTLDLLRLASIAVPGHSQDEVLVAGRLMFLAGLFFKVALIPFHAWISDVYESSRKEVTTFLATVSKIAVFCPLVRFLVAAGGTTSEATWSALALIAIVSILGGNLLALGQERLRTLLAYSSVAHSGYVLSLVISGNPLAWRAAIFYLVVYLATTLVAFGIVCVAHTTSATSVSDLRGLAWRRPFLAAVLTIALLSLAGIPLTGGFVSKLLVIQALVGARTWLPLIAVLLGSAIGLYVYLRIVSAMFATTGEGTNRIGKATLPTRFLLGLLGLAIVWFGVAPKDLLELGEEDHAAVPSIVSRGGEAEEKGEFAFRDGRSEPSIAARSSDH